MPETTDKRSEQPAPLSLLDLFLALLGGTTIFLGLAPYGMWYIALLGIFILASLIRTARKTSHYFFIALVFYFGMFASGVHWLYVSIHTFGQVPALLAAIFTLGFALFIASICALPWLLLRFVARESYPRVIVFPAFWLISEWLRGWILTGFPWLYAGQAHLHTPLAGWIPIVGVLGTGFMVALTASALLTIFTQRKPLDVVGQSVVLILIWGGGSILNKMDWTTPMPAQFEAALVQPDIKLMDKWNPNKAGDIIDQLEALSDEHWQDGLVVWPEAALPYVGEEAQDYLQKLNENISGSNSAFVSGYLTYNSETGRYHNAIGGGGLAEGEYLKQRLVPFGEYVPMESVLRGIMHFFDLPMSIIAAGESGQQGLKFTLNGETFVVAPAVCYEIAYASLVADLAEDANLIITLSNDAWFADSIGPWQHMEIAQSRALENRKPLLRVTNNGVTATVDHRGNIVDALPQFQPGVLTVSIQARSGQTPFNLFGYWLVLALSAITIGFSMLYQQRQTRQQSPIEE